MNDQTTIEVIADADFHIDCGQTCKDTMKSCIDLCYLVAFVLTGAET